MGNVKKLVEALDAKPHYRSTGIRWLVDQGAGLGYAGTSEVVYQTAGMSIGQWSGCERRK
jgi:hypothetical protein